MTGWTGSLTYLKDQVFPDGEGADEQVVLLDVRGDGRQQLAVDGHAVNGPHAGFRHVTVAPERQRVQKGSFSGAAGPHQRQELARTR